MTIILNINTNELQYHKFHEIFTSNGFIQTLMATFGLPFLVNCWDILSTFTLCTNVLVSVLLVITSTYSPSES